LLDEKVQRFGRVLLLAAHSMPSTSRVPTLAGGDARTARADVVPGSRGRTSADPRFIDLVEAHAKAQGWTVRHDQPYKGSFVTARPARPSADVRAVPAAPSGRLYMDERTLPPAVEACGAGRRWCQAGAPKVGKRGIG